jgi:ElaB/YqjD/DUF883 family membrane-anchored ribosome-binding protein
MEPELFARMGQSAMPRLFTLLAAGVCAYTLTAFAQDAPPLGDVARQTRVEKQQQAPSNSAPASAADSSSDTPPSQSAQPKASHVITNEDLPTHYASPVPAPAPANHGNLRPAATEIKRPAAYWKAQAQQLKNSIAQVQRHIDTLTDSLHAVLTNSTDEPVWNLREKERQRQITDLQAQLNDLRRRLEDTQDAARRQGYGSSVYDP